MGMPRLDVARLFLTHGLVIGSVGVTLGLGLGLGACWILVQVQQLELPLGIYIHAKLPVKFLSWEYAVIASAAWALSIVAALYPALVSGRGEPSSGLRHL